MKNNNEKSCRRRMFYASLQLVIVLIQIWQTLLQALTFASILHDLIGFRCWLGGISGQDLPMIKYALWEGLSSCVRAKISCEAERLVDGQVCLDDEHRCSSDLRFFENVSTTTIQHTIDTSDGNFWTLNFAKIDGLHETWCGCDERSIQAATSSWNDLTTTAMDGVSVKCDVINVESHGWERE